MVVCVCVKNDFHCALILLLVIGMNHGKEKQGERGTTFYNYFRLIALRGAFNVAIIFRKICFDFIQSIWCLFI